MFPANFIKVDTTDTCVFPNNQQPTSYDDNHHIQQQSEYNKPDEHCHVATWVCGKHVGRANRSVKEVTANVKCEM